jgi:NAD(P)-dependent dehydrogenase (short-subunit alcohol dehydrogenase family)
MFTIVVAMPSLPEKNVLITGATGGLGKAVVRAFLREGAFVAGTSRHWSSDDAVDGLLQVQADLTTPEGAESAVRAVVQARGRLDAVVHLMGGFAMDGPLPAARVAAWDRMMVLNARSAFLIFSAALEARQQGVLRRLIAVGSRAGVQPSPGAIAYAVSKAALHALVVNLAASVADKGIAVNAVLPGVIDTEANRKAMPGADFSKWVAPESIAETLVWLASDAASNTSGALIPVYGRS